jgi:hypothetical protein
MVRVGDGDGVTLGVTLERDVEVTTKPVWVAA